MNLLAYGVATIATRYDVPSTSEVDCIGEIEGGEENWRKMKDSNPRSLAALLISNQLHYLSANLPENVWWPVLSSGLLRHSRPEGLLNSSSPTPITLFLCFASACAFTTTLTIHV